MYSNLKGRMVIYWLSNIGVGYTTHNKSLIIRSHEDRISRTVQVP